MRFPEQFDHHGLLYIKTIDMTTDGKIILSYKCVNHPDVGPEVKGEIPNLAPDDTFIEEALSSIRYKISEFVTTLAILQDKIDKKGAAEAAPSCAPSKPICNPEGE